MYPRAYKGISSRLIARVVIRGKCRERTRHVKVPTRKSVHVLKTWVNVQTKKEHFFRTLHHESREVEKRRQRLSLQTVSRKKQPHNKKA